MPNLQPVEEVRLANFLELQSRVGGYGAPTAAHLASFLSEHGQPVTPTQLTAIYQKEKPISSSFAAQVEQALTLPKGWLSESHDFLFKLSPSELAVHSAFASLPANVKADLSSLILHLASGNSTQVKSA